MVSKTSKSQHRIEKNEYLRYKQIQVHKNIKFTVLIKCIRIVFSVSLQNIKAIIDMDAVVKNMPYSFHYFCILMLHGWKG